MAIPPELALTPDERDAVLGAQWNMRISTTSPSGRINATPLWFVWHDGKVWAYCRGQKVDNLRRDPRCTVLVDRGEEYHQLQGIMIQGDVRILEDADAEAAEPELASVREIYGRKYSAGPDEDAEPMAASARGRSWRWVVVTPVTIVTWDNTKLPG